MKRLARIAEQYRIKRRARSFLVAVALMLAAFQVVGLADESEEDGSPAE